LDAGEDTTINAEGLLHPTAIFGTRGEVGSSRPSGAQICRKPRIGDAGFGKDNRVVDR
jgi:hypothetical protein